MAYCPVQQCQQLGNHTCFMRLLPTAHWRQRVQLIQEDKGGLPPLCLLTCPLEGISQMLLGLTWDQAALTRQKSSKGTLFRPLVK
jgi:hypothetical protein